MADNSQIRYLNPIDIEVKKSSIVGLKNQESNLLITGPEFLMKFVNEQGKLLPRRLTGTSAKYQKKVSQAVKRARHLAILPYLADQLK